MALLPLNEIEEQELLYEWIGHREESEEAVEFKEGMSLIELANIHRR